MFCKARTSGILAEVREKKVEGDIDYSLGNVQIIMPSLIVSFDFPNTWFSRKHTFHALKSIFDIIV